jgi:diguanylate cyclase (GGDEF)-like protein
MSPRTPIVRARQAARPAKPKAGAKSARRGRIPAEATAAHRAALADVIALVRAQADPAAALGHALDRLATAVAFESATFFLLDEKGSGLRPVATRGAHVDLIPDVRFDLGTGLSSWVARTGRPVLLSDLRGDARPDAPEAPRHGSFVSVPLLVDRTSIGVLNAASRQPGAFSEADRDLLVAAAAALAAPLVARRAAREAECRPGLDRATGLPNRLAFEERVAEAIERGRRYAERCAIAVLAIDGIAALRRGAGEEAANEALAATAALLAAKARKSDVVARLAPEDAFALLLPHQGEEAAGRAVDRLVSAIARHGFAGRRRLSATSGLAVWPVAKGPGADPFASAETCAQEIVAAALAEARGAAAAAAPADTSARVEAA